MERGKHMESIPTDLILEIFARLPSKSVARFRTLSKHWASTLRSPEFTKLFLSRSSTRPRLFFAVERYGYNEWHFFSSPQSQNRYEKSAHLDFHSKFSGDVSQYSLSYASGLIYFPVVRINGTDTIVICNPLTGMYVGLPELMKYSRSKGFLGFDPIDKQFKAVEIDYASILTLGSGELKWRVKDRNDIPRPLYHRFPWTQGICINGVLYFLAKSYLSETVSLIVSFDCSSEEFKFIEAACLDDHIEDPTGLILVNYMGKLGVTNCKCVDAGGRRTVELCMWVLEDVEKLEWVKYLYTLPENEVLASCEFSVTGVTATGDIVLCVKYTCKPYYVFYFNPGKKTLQTVEIQGFGAKLEEVDNRGEVFAYVDYVEDLSLNDATQLNSSISHIKSLCSCSEKLPNNVGEEV
ncbi:F-box-like domain superfamily [Arabidopsis thaliana x Arabidopsis arenosa]|uniref:F-box-like domain superfamily n=2 Tax=Arabidopsis TaxID=3701 RepID=A0A8T1ZYF8_ARASU|nr:F-box-like domain superfamily [Arabidopsis thaliana x Arabidopsis arenosa]KAG7565972.1 F-box-like domain superfamily [Arabidopsis suecica]